MGHCACYIAYIPGADPGFQVRGGGVKKKCAERREARKLLGYFVRKITILRQKIIFFCNVRGARGREITRANLIGGLKTMLFKKYSISDLHLFCFMDSRVRVRTVVGFTTTCAIRAYHHYISHSILLYWYTIGTNFTR